MSPRVCARAHVIARLIETGNSESVRAPRPSHDASFPRKGGPDGAGAGSARGRAGPGRRGLLHPTRPRPAGCPLPAQSTRLPPWEEPGAGDGSAQKVLDSCLARSKSPGPLSPEHSVLTREMDPECRLVTWNGGGARSVRRGRDREGLVAGRVPGPLSTDTQVPESWGRWGQRCPS